MEPSALMEKATAVARACQQRDIIGYISIDFVTFIDPKTVRSNSEEIFNSNYSHDS